MPTEMETSQARISLEEDELALVEYAKEIACFWLIMQDMDKKRIDLEYGMASNDDGDLTGDFPYCFPLINGGWSLAHDSVFEGNEVVHACPTVTNELVPKTELH